MPTLDKQDALMTDKDEVAGAESVVAAVPTVGNDTLLDANENDDWKLDGVVGLNEIARAGV